MRSEQPSSSWRALSFRSDNLFQQTSLDFTAVFLAYPLIWLGIHLPFTRVGAVNDYSYGIYIYAFPIQQLLVMWGINTWGYLPYTLLSRSCGDSPGGRKLVAHREARAEAEGPKGTKAPPMALNLEIEHIPLTFTSDDPP